MDCTMQGAETRAKARKRWRDMAADMADRYLPRVEAFRNRNVTQFRRLLSDEPPRLSESKFRELAAQVDREEKRLEVSPARRVKIEALVASYVAGAQSDRKSVVWGKSV